jgi:preprotein translocase subunit SecB
MDATISHLQFKHYVANKILFEINDDYGDKEGKIIELRPKITSEISEPKGKYFDATLSVKIDNDEGQNDLPFKMEISIIGFFKVEDDIDCKDALIKKNSIAILFPYLRSLTTAVTAGANIEPLILPVMDLSGLSEEE